MCATSCNGGEYCACKKVPGEYLGHPSNPYQGNQTGYSVPQQTSTYIGGGPFPRPNIYSAPLPPWPTLEEIRKAIRDELRKAGFEPEARTAPPSGRAGVV